MLLRNDVKHKFAACFCSIMTSSGEPLSDYPVPSEDTFICCVEKANTNAFGLAQPCAGD